jgi:hypothetical protein
MFGYRCGIQSSTKLSPFMILTGRTPCLRADNYLHSWTTKVDDTADVEIIAKQFMQKVKLIASIHENVLLNVGHAQQNRKGPMLPEKGNRLLKV